MPSFKLWKRFAAKSFRLDREENVEKTYLEIKQGTDFSGHNWWILFFAMFIACIGLNTDSISAVIGAMLISPLMGPIIGFAFGLSINDQTLKKNGITNWALMTITSLLASSLYFLVSPFDQNTTVLGSFKKATIFDILLAFFGGMAGFIGIMKKEGTKVIAGVAVATACMPPLCTAGFGLVHLDFEIFFGGLYFYIINCLFIGLGTFLLSRFNRFENDFHTTIHFEQTTNWLWSIFIVIMIVPGIWIAIQKYQQEQQKSTIQLDYNSRINLLEKKVKSLDSLLQINN